MSKQFTTTKGIVFTTIMTVTPLIIGSLVGYFFKPDKWYSTLVKPRLTPPPIAFGIVWPILYLMIGFSGALALYGQTFYFWVIPGLHLITNFLFSPINFGMHNLLGGSIMVSVTLLLAIITSLQYLHINNNTYASILMIPYMIWLCFANYLSWSFWKLN